MENFVIRILIASLVLAAMHATVAGRFIHRIEDYDMPTNEFVAECRKGCLIKVCTPESPSQWQFNLRMNLPSTVPEPTARCLLDRRLFLQAELFHVLGLLLDAVPRTEEAVDYKADVHRRCLCELTF